MKIAILILLGLSYILNSIVLGWVYPNVSTDLDEYIQFVATRNKVYELMFAGFFLLTFLISNKLLRAIACFFFCLSLGSFIDKMMGVTWYLKSDLILIFLSLSITIYLYVREYKSRG